MKYSLSAKGQKKEIISIFNDRIIDWIDENPGVKVLPEIVDVENNNFTFVVGIFKEIKPTVKVIPIRTESGMTIRTDVVFETPNYKNTSLLKECIQFLGDYFNYLVIEDSPVEEILSVKKFDVSEINNFVWQKVKYRFVKKENSMKKIKTYEDFVNEEVNLRKGLMGAALGAGLALSNPATSQTTIKPAISVNQQTTSIDGWGKVKWGMIKSEVIKLYPESKEDAFLKPICVSTSGMHHSENSGFIPQFGIPGYLISGRKYNIAFIFEKDKLSSVELILIRDISFDESWLYIFRSIEEKIIEKYNNPLFEKNDNNIHRTKWVSKNGTIELKMDGTKGWGSFDDVLLVIIYKKIEESGF